MWLESVHLWGLCYLSDWPIDLAVFFVIVLILIDWIFVDWVEAVWDNDFLDIPSLPAEVESLLEDRVQLGNSLCELHGALKPWAKGEDATSGQGLWNYFLSKIKWN